MTIFAATVLQTAALADEKPKTEPTVGKPPEQAGVAALYDTGTALPDPGAAPFKIEADKWTKIGDPAAVSIKGDAVLCNPYASAVARKDGTGVDLYAQAAGGWVHRARLALVAGGGATTFTGTASVPGDGSTAAVTVKSQGAAAGALEFSLAAGSPLLKTTAKGKADGLRISAPCRWGVLPDFFTDDLLVDARQMSAPRVEIPFERLYLQMLDNGNAILAVFCDKNERDIQINLSGEGEQRVMKDADVFFGGEGGSIWAGTMEQKGIWHCRDLSNDENQKGVKLDWDVPFDAVWKGDFTQADRDVHSEDGRKWITWVGNAPKKGVVNIPGGQRFTFEGPLMVYPVRRSDQTPLDMLLLDDCLRLSLGSGPCAYILDAEGRKGVYKGIFTCSYDWTIPRMAPNGLEEVSFLKEQRLFLRTIHKSVLTFMEFIESRIGLYAEFRKEMLGILEEREKKNPDLAGFIGKMKKIVSSLPEKAPTGSRQLAPSLQVVEKAILIDTPDQVAASLKPMGLPPRIAEPQDVQLAECRRIVKVLRARAMAEFVRDPALGKNPAATEIVKEIRGKSLAVLRGPASHEGFEATNW